MPVLSRLICGEQSGVIEDLHLSFGVIGRLPRVIRNESERYRDWVISENVSRGYLRAGKADIVLDTCKRVGVSWCTRMRKSS